MDSQFRTYATAAEAAAALVSQAQGALVRPLAPEDAAPGMYITIMVERVEWFPRSMFMEASALLAARPMKWDRIPEDSGTPLRIAGVCLPFMLVQTPQGAVRTVDVRQMSVARLTDAYGREAFARLARAAAPPKSSSDDDDE